MAKNDKASEGTFSSWPFITHDGVDKKGVRAEVEVVLGYGDVVSVDESDKGNSQRASFAVSNTKWNLAGWTRSENVQEVLRKAQESNEPVHFRIETRRKPGIDRSVPFSELDKEKGAEVVKSLAAVKFEGDEEWTVSDDMVTRFDEDPDRNSDGIVKAGEQDVETLKSGDSGETKNESPWNTKTHSEPPPYVAKWNNQVNPGSISVNAILGFLENLNKISRETDVTVKPDVAKNVAKNLLRVANQLQKDIYVKHLKVDYHGVDLTAGSHTKARAFIFETIRSYCPLSNDILSDDESIKKWLNKVYTISYGMWVWTLESIEEYVFPGKE